MAKRDTLHDIRATKDAERTARRRQIMACRRHPERVAIVEEGGVNKCWECYIGRVKFEKRCRRRGTTIEAYYQRPDNRIDLFNQGR